MNHQNIRKSNRAALLVLLCGAALTLLVMSLPLYSFQLTVLTKKSPNTFVGDEKYQEVKAEVEEEARLLQESGMNVSIDETVTERVNSKGEKTSLITFQVGQKMTRNLWSFLRGSLSSCHVLRLMAILFVLGIVLAFAGAMTGMDVTPRLLGNTSRKIRSLSCVCFLLDILLTPVFILLNNRIFWRRLSLYNQGLITEGSEQFYRKVGSFLLGSGMGEDPASSLGSMDVLHSPMVWLLMLCFVVCAVAAVWLRFGAVKNVILRTLLYVFIVTVCVVTLFPYYVMFITAFRSNAEALDMYFLHMMPVRWVWSNLKDIVSRGVLRYLANSFMVAGGATILAMLCGIPAAFAMARMNFRGKKFFLGFVIMSQMFSPVVLLIGISQLMNSIYLNDTIPGLIFINAAFNQAFAIWLLRGTFVAISPEMEQAARIDGCSTMGSLIRVLLPMAAPGIVTTLIFVFINAWNEYTISTVLISTASKRPITVGITQFSSFNMIEWQYLFAASLLATVPVVILFMAIEKHLTSGLTSGGVKG